MSASTRVPVSAPNTSTPTSKRRQARPGTKYWWISSLTEESIREGFSSLKPQQEYKSLYEAGLCRAIGDWLLGMNATRLYTIKYGGGYGAPPLSIGRVQTPTLALIVRRQLEIENFKPEPYWVLTTVYRDTTFKAVMADPNEDEPAAEGDDKGDKAKQQQQAPARRGFTTEEEGRAALAKIQNEPFVVTAVDKKRGTEQPPRLFDLTSLQVECNKKFGYSADLTLSLIQSLYEKKLATYPRTDSQFITDDMEDTARQVISIVCRQLPLFSGVSVTPDIARVTDNSKVTDHHAILPTMQGAKCNKEKLSETKRKILSLIIWKLVQAVQPPFIYEDVLVTVCCQGRNFTAKYKDVLQPGYTAKPVPFVEPEKDKVVPLPKKMEQGMVLPVVRAEKKQGFTSPPKVYTEDTLLSAMETAGNKEFEKDTEKKGLGTPATRAAILEKLVSAGYVQRKGKQMIPTEDGVAAIHNIPDYLKSASMTAEWENDLLRMERGEIKPHDFMQGIHGLLDKMLADLRQIPTVAAAPYYNKVGVGSCPVCGNPVHESKLSFCCADRSCKFALWKESRYLSNMRKTLDKKMAEDLLKKGRTHVKDFYSVKKDKTFAADLVMRVEDGRAQYSLEFPKTPMKTKT